MTKAQGQPLTPEEKGFLDLAVVEFNREYAALCNRHGMQISASPSVNISIVPFINRPDPGIVTGVEQA